MLSQTIDVRFGGKPCFQTEVLAFEDQRCGSGVKENFGCRAAEDLECEGVGMKDEFEVRFCG